ncbi:hypothetical protein D0Y65_046104 [Glycine soja]|uniref:Uncharacterized protein n=1 Tax=Glycine soja TaxID=3848 RepID=A0A445G7X2_GLYSO|nr:hypothetical protein D0Y65_046104 [Glycine soja]
MSPRSPDPRNISPVYPKDLTLSKLKSYAKSLQSWGSPLASGRWYGTFGMSSDPCMLKLSKWSVDFNTNSVKYTHAQCWILIRRLTQEYWRPRILIEIATTVSTLIALDESTRSRNFGHFARLLVDIDLSGNLPNEILVERYSYTFLCWHRL